MNLSAACWVGQSQPYLEYLSYTLPRDQRLCIAAHITLARLLLRDRSLPNHFVVIPPFGESRGLGPGRQIGINWLTMTVSRSEAFF